MTTTTTAGPPPPGRFPTVRNPYAALPAPPTGSLPALPGAPQRLLAEDAFGTVRRGHGPAGSLLLAAGVVAAVALATTSSRSPGDAAVRTLVALAGVVAPTLVLTGWVRLALGRPSRWGLCAGVRAVSSGPAHLHLGAAGLPWVRAVLTGDAVAHRRARAGAVLPLVVGLAVPASLVLGWSLPPALAGLLPGLLVGVLATVEPAQRLADALAPATVPPDVRATVAHRLGADDDPTALIRALADGDDLGPAAAGLVDRWLHTLTGPEHRQSGECTTSIRTGGSQGQRLLVAAGVQHLVVGLDLLDGWSADIPRTATGRYAKMRTALDLLRHQDPRGAFAALPAGDDLWTRLIGTACHLADGDRAAARARLGQPDATAWVTQEPFLALAREVGLQHRWADALTELTAAGRVHPVTSAVSLALLRPDRAVDLAVTSPTLAQPVVEALAVTGETDHLEGLETWLAATAADSRAGVRDTGTAALARLAQGRPREADRLWARVARRAPQELPLRYLDWVAVLRGRSAVDVSEGLLLPADPSDLWLRATACRVQALGSTGPQAGRS